MAGHSDTPFEPGTDELIARNATYAASFSDEHLSVAPAKHQAIVACMDSRMTEDALKANLEAELGIKPWWALASFTDPYADTLQSMRRLELSPFIPHKQHVRGFVYDVDTGLLHEVELEE